MSEPPHPADADTVASEPAGHVTATLPRLSIIHIMLWTLCSAVYPTLIRAIYALQDSPKEYATLQNTSTVFQAAVTGAVLAGAIVLLQSRLRTGRPMLRQPGHWLLVTSALLTVAYLPALLVVVLQQARMSILLIGLVYLIPAAMYAVACRRSELRRWKFAFGTLAGSAAIQTVASVPGFTLLLWTIPRWGNYLLCGWIVLVSISEFSTDRRRDWLHWAGVGTFFAGTGLSLLWMIWSWFI